MEQYKNLTIIGTSHISIESIKEVESTLLKIKPDIIALELDSIRFKALLQPKRKISFKDIKEFGFKGFLLNFLGALAEKKLGKIVSVKPGSEMETAIKIAKKLKSKIQLIDQPIHITLKKLSKNITFKEKCRFIYEIIKTIFIKPKIEFDLSKVPDKKLVKKLTNKIKKDYPSVYNVLIKERDIYMAKNLYNSMKTNKKIVAIVGVGHEDSIINIIKNDKIL